MENLSIEKERYQNEKREARGYYATIGSVWCPILNGRVNFNRVGFGHLIRKGTKPRAMDDQMRRFRLLKYAKNVIGSECSFLIQKNRDGATGDRVRFWAVACRIDNRIIVVVIRQTKMGQKNFFSIYDQKTAQ